MKGSLEHILEGGEFIGVLGAIGAILVVYIAMIIIGKMLDDKKDK